MKTRTRIFLTVMFIFVESLSVAPLTTYADVAPPDAPPGKNLLPGDETTIGKIVMES